MAELSKDAKSIFLAAIDIADAAAREWFVSEQTAGDSGLKRRVESL